MMLRSKSTRRVAIWTHWMGVFTIGLLVSCSSNTGTDGNVGGSENPVVKLPAIAASPILSYTPMKGITLSWTDINDATYYRVLENPDGSSGFSAVGADVPSGQEAIELTSALFLRDRAQYILQSCNQAGCVDSTVVSVSGHLVNSIGYLKSDFPSAQDEFGHAIDISGDGTTMAISARYEDSLATGVNGSQNNDDSFNAGAVYVFALDGNQWINTAYLKASNARVGDVFGQSVSLSEDGKTLAVGAYAEDGSSTGVNGNQNSLGAGNSGAVYVFALTDTGWVQQAYIKASNPEADDLFGEHVELSGDGLSLAVSAQYESSSSTTINGDQSNNDELESGAVYVFAFDGSEWAQQAYLKASNAEAEDLFGASLAFNHTGSVLAVGATGEDSNAQGLGGDAADNTALESGAVYVFSKSGATWSQDAYLKASNTQSGDEFGASVAMSRSGLRLVVGAPGESNTGAGVISGNGSTAGGLLGSGAVYTFSKDSGQWIQESYIKASNPDEFDSFGVSVALNADGDLLAVGADGESSNSIGISGDQSNNNSSSSGAVYVFQRQSSAWRQVSYLKAIVADQDDAFGRAIALSKDGSTLAVGAFKEDSGASGVQGDAQDNSLTSAGAVFLY